MKIEIQQDRNCGNLTVSADISSDADIYELGGVLKDMIRALGYSPVCVDEIFSDEINW